MHNFATKFPIFRQNSHTEYFSSQINKSVFKNRKTFHTKTPTPKKFPREKFVSQTRRFKPSHSCVHPPKIQLSPFSSHEKTRKKSTNAHARCGISGSSQIPAVPLANLRCRSNWSTLLGTSTRRSTCPRP